jgi:hypothetical protein
VILESELLSIHASAIMWEAVLVAHKRALRAISAHHCNGHTRALAVEASGLMSRLEAIHTLAIELAGPARWAL